MRLQLNQRPVRRGRRRGCHAPLLVWLSLTAGMSVAAPAVAAGRTGTLVSVFVDDDGLTVVSPQLSVEQEVAPQFTTALAYDVDIISAATVDVRTAASPRGYDEVRHGLNIGTTWQPEAESSLGLRYLPSWEADFESHGVGTDVSHEWWDRRLTTQVTVLGRFNQVGRSGEPKNTWRYLGTGILGLQQGMVLDRFTVATVAYELSMSRGYLSNPYRFVTVNWASGRAVSVPEQTPSERNRHAGRVGVQRALTHDIFIDAGYRLYGDDWGVVSHTGDAEVQYALADDLLIFGLAIRGYYQSAAAFYEPRYRASTGTVPMLRTGDKQLTESWSVLGDARLEVNVTSVGSFDVLRGGLKVGVYDQHFLEFEPLDSRRALIVSLGVSGEH